MKKAFWNSVIVGGISAVSTLQALYPDFNIKVLYAAVLGFASAFLIELSMKSRMLPDKRATFFF